ncbi:hypothetical protein FRB90_003319, partial [Tulasnella sp. 427]
MRALRVLPAKEQVDDITSQNIPDSTISERREYCSLTSEIFSLRSAGANNVGQPLNEDNNADAESSDGEGDEIPNTATVVLDRTAQAPRSQFETSVPPTSLQRPNASAANNTITATQPLTHDDDGDDGPPGLAFVSGSSDFDEESRQDSGQDDQMPVLEPIELYAPQQATAENNNTTPQAETNASADIASYPIVASGNSAILLVPDPDGDVPIFTHVNTSDPDTASLANRAREMVEKMHVLTKDELKRYQTLVLVQADNEDDRDRGAACSVCWEGLSPFVKGKDACQETGEKEGRDERATEHELPHPAPAVDHDSKPQASVENKIVALPCGHVFHAMCLVPWLTRNPTCPECRFNLDPSRAVPNGGPQLLPLRRNILRSRDVYDIQRNNSRDGDAAASSTTTRRASSLPRDINHSTAENPLRLEPNDEARIPEPSGVLQTDPDIVASMQEQVVDQTSSNPDARTTAASQVPATAPNDGPSPDDANRGQLSNNDVEQRPGQEERQSATSSTGQAMEETARASRPMESPHLASTLDATLDRIAQMESRLANFESRLGGFERLTMSNLNGSALDSPQALRSRRQMGTSEVESRGDAIRRLRSLAATASGPTSATPAESRTQTEHPVATTSQGRPAAISHPSTTTRADERRDFSEQQETQEQGPDADDAATVRNPDPRSFQPPPASDGVQVISVPSTNATDQSSTQNDSANLATPNLQMQLGSGEITEGAIHGDMLSDGEDGSDAGDL